MTELSTTLDGLQASFAAALQSVVAYLPRFAAALLLVLAGWLLAKLMRVGASKLGVVLNRLLLRLGRWHSTRRTPQLPQAMLTLLGNVAFWLVLLIAIASAAHVARLELFTVWLDRIVVYLPSLLAGGLILLAGYLVSVVARDVVATALESAGSEQSDFFGVLAQGAIFVAALVIGLAQIGLDVTFLTLLFGIGTGGLLFGIALAFGLGASGYVSNLIGAQQLRGQLTPGQTARIGEDEGQVVELTPTAVVLATERGRLSIPARRFQEEATLIVLADDNE